MNINNQYQNNQEPNREENQYEEEGAEVEQELSEVASNPKQNMLILVGIGLVFIYVFYSFFITSDDNEDDDDVPVPTSLDNPSDLDTSGSVPTIPTLPSPPKLEDPTLPPPPPVGQEGDEVQPLDLPTPQEQNNPPALPGAQDGSPSLLLPPSDITPSLPDTSIEDDQEKARIKQKRSSSIVLISGVQNTKTPEEIRQETDFKFRGNMNLMLARGKLIDAVIESAVNTDIGGEIRAIVSRDIYSEWGKNILVPKGSKIFGSYTQGIEGSYGRIAIAWERLDLINGYSVNIGGSALAIDDLGRRGVQGRVDNKFKEQFSNAVLRSAFNIALANVLDSLVEPTQNSQEAATQNTQAASIRNIANAANADPATATSERERICSEILNVITDKTSTTFSTINTACQDLRIQNNGATEVQKLASIKSTINTAADGLIQVSVQAAEATKAQQASEESFDEISNTIKKMVDQQDFKPTITIDQGTHIKIYVNRDFVFPKEAVGRSRRIR